MPSRTPVVEENPLGLRLYGSIIRIINPFTQILSFQASVATTELSYLIDQDFAPLARLASCTSPEV